MAAKAMINVKHISILSKITVKQSYDFVASKLKLWSENIAGCIPDLIKKNYKGLTM